MALGFSNIGAGPVTMQVNASGTVLGPRTSASHPGRDTPKYTTKEVYYRKRANKAPQWDGISFTVGNVSNGFEAGPFPGGLLYYGTVSNVDTRKFDLGIDDQEYTKEAFIGGQADFYRITDGVFSHLRTSTVTDASLGTWQHQSDNGDVPTAAVNGASQTGTGLILDGLGFTLTVGQTFRIANLDNTYTIDTINSQGGGSADIVLTTSLESSPADDAVITFTGITNLEVLYTQAGGYSYRFGGSFVTNREVWFGVAAVDSNNEYNPANIAYDSVTPTNNTDPGVPDNSNVVVRQSSFAEGTGLAAPANVTATLDAGGHRVVNITWDAVGSAVGYVVFLSYTDPATHTSNQWLELENDGGAAIQDGDLCIFRHRILEPSVAMLGTRAGNALSIYRPIWTQSAAKEIFNGTYTDITATYVRFDNRPSNALTKVGNYYMNIAMGASSTVGDILAFSINWTGPPDETTYPIADPSKTYKYRLFVEADKETTVKVSVNVPGVSTRSYTVAGNNTLTEIEDTFTPTGFLSSTQKAEVAFVSDGTARNIKFTGFMIAEDTVDYGLWPAALTDQISAGMVARDHAMVKPSINPYFLEDLCSPFGTTRTLGTLHSFLRCCKRAGCNPWVQIEWMVLTPTEIDNLTAFLGAPVSSNHPYALLRRDLGQTLPWFDEFTEFLFELGNESWQGNPSESFMRMYAMSPYNKAETYGLMYEYLIDRMLASEYFDPKVEFIVGGRSKDSYGADAASKITYPVQVGIANYNSGRDETATAVDEDDQGYQSLIGWPGGNNEDAMDGLISSLDEMAADSEYHTYGSTVKPTCYEAGPGYQLGLTDAGNIYQEVVLKSYGAATATLNTALLQASKGFTRFNFFTLGEGDTWTTQAPSAQGGHTFYPWEFIKLIHNRIGKGKVSRATAIRDDGASAFDIRGNAVDINAIDCFWITSSVYPGRNWLVVHNRDQSRTVPLVVNGPKINTSSVVVYKTGPYDNHNRYIEGYRLHGRPRVNGGSQSGTTLVFDGAAFPVTAGMTFTIDGVTGTYEIDTVTSQDQENVEVELTSSLASSPAENADITFTAVDEDGYIADSKCVHDSITPGTQVSIPGDLSEIVFDTSVGAASGGVPPGVTIILEFYSDQGFPALQLTTGTPRVVTPNTYNPDILGRKTVSLTTGNPPSVTPTTNGPSLGGGWAGTTGTPASATTTAIAPTVAAGSASQVPEITDITFLNGNPRVTMSTTGDILIRIDDTASHATPATFEGLVQADSSGEYNLEYTGLTTGVNNIAMDLAAVSSGAHYIHALPRKGSTLGTTVKSRELTFETAVGLTTGTPPAVTPTTTAPSASFGSALTTTFAIVNTGGDGRPAAQPTATMSGTAGNIWIAVVASRLGYASTTLNISGGDEVGDSWALIQSDDNELLDTNARLSYRVWRKRITAADQAAGAQVITGQANTGQTGMAVWEISANDPNYNFYYQTFSENRSGTAAWNGLSSGNTPSVSGENFLVMGIGVGRHGSPPSNRRVITYDDTSNVFGATNHFSFLFGIKSQGQGSGTYSTTIEDLDGSNDTEGMVATVILRGYGA